MPSLLSGKSLRRGGSGQFLDIKGAQPQFPPDADTSTGYTIVTDALYRTTTTNVLGNLKFFKGEVYSNAGQNIQLIGTGTSTVIVLGGSINTSTSTGALIVKGGIGIQNGLWTGDDIHVNGLTIGQGYQGINNIVIYGVANTLTNDLKEGENSIAIGYSTLQSISSTLKTIAVGNHAITSGTNVANSIAIGDSALRLIGSTQTAFVGNITGLLTYNPARVTLANHGLSSGTFVLLNNIVGTTELNYSSNGNIGYYVDVVDINSFDLYSDINLNNSVNATLFGSYSNPSGTVTRPYKLDSNIAIGTNAGSALIDGTQNFFFGNNIASNFTTGSYNFFIGHEVGLNMTKGNANIAIGGDNLVDGLDNQINIGSVFYYDGGGNLQLNADTFLGLGSHSNGTGDGGLAVYGGVGISDNLNVGTTLDVESTGTFQLDVIIDRNLSVTGQGNVTLSPQGGNVVIEPTAGGILTISVTGNSNIDGADIGVYSAKDGHFLSLYSNNLTVVNTITGSINTATDIQYGNTGSIAIQSAPGNTAFIPIGDADTVLVSNGTTATWRNPNSLQSSTATNAEGIFVNTVTDTNYFLVLTTGTNQYSPVNGTSDLAYNVASSTLTTPYLTVTNTATVIGSVYSQDGIADENNLLYTPRVTIAVSAPLDPRVGDFWIDPTYGVELQYVNDGGNKFWIQFTGL